MKIKFNKILLIFLVFIISIIAFSLVKKAMEREKLSEEKDFIIKPIDVNAKMGKYIDSARQVMEKFLDSLKRTMVLKSPGYIQMPLMPSDDSIAQNLVDDFIAGKTKTCISDGSGKAKGLKFQFKYPSPWSEAEADRPNVAKKIQSDNHAEIQIMVLVWKLNQIPTNIEKEILLSYNGISSDIKSGDPNVVIDNITTNLKIDEELASRAIWTTSVKRLESSLKIKSLSYVFCYEDYQIMLSFGVSPNNGDIDYYFLQHEMLFKLIAGSFVLISKWQ